MTVAAWRRTAYAAGLALPLSLAPGWTTASPPPSPADLETVVVRGIVPEDTARVPGSIDIVESTRLRRMAPVTAKEVLRLLPGVAVVEEDALGLKLNVSVRGLTPRRSGRTLLLEDGMPIQPAPYADPSAHYYPPLDRVERIELRRGSAQIPYGPQSVGGVLNFVSHPVRLEPHRLARLGAGERGYQSAHLAAGSGDGRSGWDAALTHKSTDGIRANHDSRIDEGVLRARLELAGDHMLDLKLAHYVEDTRLTEGGLDQARYSRDPFATPFASDRFKLDRTAVQGIHRWQLTDAALLSTQAYATSLYRSSYRQADTSTDEMVANPATGCLGAARTDYEGFAPACGNKMRPRRFRFHGVETRLDASGAVAGGQLQASAGLRVHIEDTDRRRYNGLTADARETSAGTRLRDHNRIGTHAYAAFLQGGWSRGRLTVTPSVRVEHVETRNEALQANFMPVSLVARSADTTVLPGLGVNWSVDPDVVLFFGQHRGFAPPRPDRDFNPNAPFNAVRPERSLETEAGVRARLPGRGSVQAVLYDLKLDDLIVEGPLVGGRSGSFVNAGRAVHRGLELSGEWRRGGVGFAAAYSWLYEATLRSDVDLGASGVRGKRVPYAPVHQFDIAMDVGLGRDLFLEVGVNFLDEQFATADNVRAGSADGMSGLIPARRLWRATLRHEPAGSALRLHLSAQNLFDSKYVASRVDGLFAGMPRLVTAGVEYRF